MDVRNLRDTQRCATCKADVALQDYSPSYRGVLGKDCKRCKRAGETRRRRERGVQPKSPPWTPEYRRQYQKDWKVANPDKRLASHLKTTYGDLITLDEYQNALVAQNGLCAVCHQPETRRTPSGGIALLAADHCHSTGVFRGLLCARCNFALGYAKEDPIILRALAAYLESGWQSST